MCSCVFLSFIFILFHSQRNKDDWFFPLILGNRSGPERHVGLFQVRPPGAAQGMRRGPRCGSADGLIWISSRPGSFECSEGGLFQSFLLALECKMLGWPLVLGYRRVPGPVDHVAEENGPVFQDQRCSCCKALVRLIPDL